ncbi:MAG: tetratricopeptide repeat protein [Terrimicrobiaceae bacterium]
MFRPLLAAVLFSTSIAWAQFSTPDAEEAKNIAIERVLADYGAQKYDEALERLFELKDRHPSDPLILNLMGSVYMKKLNYQKAEKSFRQALDIEPGFFPAAYNLGELLFLQQKYPLARQYYETMRATDHRHELLQFKVALCDIMAGENERAAKLMNTIKYPGDSPAWYYAHAAFEHKQGNPSKAREYIRGAKFVYGPEKTALFDETFQTLGIATD